MLNAVLDSSSIDPWHHRKTHARPQHGVQILWEPYCVWPRICGMGKISDQHPICIRKNVIRTIRVHIIYFSNGSAHSTREWLKPCFLAIPERAVGKLYTYVSRANAHDDALRTAQNYIEFSMQIKTNENNVTDGQHLKKFAQRILKDQLVTKGFEGPTCHQAHINRQS